MNLHAPSAQRLALEPDREVRQRTGRSEPADAQSDAPHPSQRSARGLDWFVFFVADVQTGFGPFVSVYLTTQKWTQADIGLVLSIGSIVAPDRADAGRR